jgi:AraC family transcriptional regulator
MRRKLQGQQALPGLLHAFRRELQRQSLALPVALIGVYYDQAFQESGLDVEVAAPLTGRLRGSGALQVHELPGEALVACTVHHGPYAALPEAYEAVFTWLDSSGYQAAGANRDLFLQVPAPGEAQDEAVTEVQIPVRPKPFLSAVVKAKDKKEMDIQIITKPAFTVVGMPYFGKNENNEIAEMWTSLNLRYDEILNKTDAAYGLCEAMGADGRFRYLAGFGVTKVGDLPEGMEAWDVPETTYAVFPCGLTTIHETYQYAFDTWLPQSDYKYNRGIDFELYSEDFDPSTGEGGMFIYIPVVEK